MEYEFYIDVFFLVNFMMDYVVLAVSRKILKCPATHGSICLGALLGSGLACLIILLQVSYSFLKSLLFHVLINIVMIKTGLRIGWNRQIIKASVIVYISAFLLGGVMGTINPYLRESSLFFVVALGCYWVVSGIWSLLEYMAGQHKNRCEVELYKDSTILKVTALVDTGNRLRDDLTGKPVSIISNGAAKKLLSGRMPEKIRYISYHTVGTEQGVMPLLSLERMNIYSKEEKQIIDPLVAVSDGKLSADEYELILNPDVL